MLTIDVSWTLVANYAFWRCRCMCVCTVNNKEFLSLSTVSSCCKSISVQIVLSSTNKDKELAIICFLFQKKMWLFSLVYDAKHARCLGQSIFVEVTSHSSATIKSIKDTRDTQTHAHVVELIATFLCSRPNQESHKIQLNVKKMSHETIYSTVFWLKLDCIKLFSTKLKLLYCTVNSV